MKGNDLKTLIRLHTAIFQEREAIVSKLQKLDESLGMIGLSTTQKYYGLRTPTGRPRNQVSLKATICRVLDGNAFTKDEILERVLQLGYQFATNNPINSLGVVLYGKRPEFRNVNGRFSLKCRPTELHSNNSIPQR